MAKPAGKGPGDQGTQDYRNKKAYHNFDILETLEAGIVLTGAEVKSLRSGGGDLQDAYAKVERGELWVHGMKISPYAFNTARAAEAPRRPRKLLVHKREILKLRQKTLEKGLTLVPLRMYFKEGRVKVEIGLCKGRRQYERRDVIASRDAAREMDRVRKSQHQED